MIVRAVSWRSPVEPACTDEHSRAPLARSR